MTAWGGFLADDFKLTTSNYQKRKDENYVKENLSKPVKSKREYVCIR